MREEEKRKSLENFISLQKFLEEDSEYNTAILEGKTIVYVLKQYYLYSNEHDIIGVFSSLEKAMKKMEEEFKTGDDIYFIDIDFFIVDED